MKAYGIDQRYHEILASIFEKCFADIPSTKIWIFGSRAKGTQRLNSDIDLLVSGRTKKIKDRLTKLDVELKESDIPFSIDIVYLPELAKEFKADVLRTRMMLWNPEMIQRRSPWRVCPLGQHWVSRHDRPYPSGISDVDGHCRANPSKRDILMFDEMKLIEMTKLFSEAPKPNPFKSNPSWGEKYDKQIGGWVRYWNDILGLKNKIDPNIVKALIASESSFDPMAAARGVPMTKQARGLIQLMPQTRKILSDPKGELKDHLIKADKDDLFDSTVSISMGVRWLVRKQEIASRKLKREATWKEAVLEYKGILMQNPNTGKNPVIRKKLNDLYSDLGV